MANGKKNADSVLVNALDHETGLTSLRLLVEASRKNAYALSDAWQCALKATMEIAARQGEVVTVAWRDGAALLDEIFSETQPDTSLTKHVALMTNVFDMGASNAKSMREILIDAEREATDIISERMSEGLKDIRGAIAPEKRRKAA